MLIIVRNKPVKFMEIIIRIGNYVHHKKWRSIGLHFKWDSNEIQVTWQVYFAGRVQCVMHKFVEIKQKQPNACSTYAYPILKTSYLVLLFLIRRLQYEYGDWYYQICKLLTRASSINFRTTCNYPSFIKFIYLESCSQDMCQKHIPTSSFFLFSFIFLFSCFYHWTSSSTNIRQR